MTARERERRYFLRAGISMAVYVASIFAAGYLIKRHGVSGPLAYALALLPAVAIVGLFYAIGMRIQEQTDEFLRMLLVRQHLIATGVALSATSAWTLLEMYGLAPHASGIWVFVAWSVGLSIGSAVNRVTYGTWGNCW